MVHFKEVNLSFSTGVVFENLSFSIKTGSKICISGPSGKGKSSVLKMIQGYILPNAGHVIIGGLSLDKKNINDLRQKMAYVPQNVNLPVDNGIELAGLIGCADRIEDAKKYLLRLGLEQNMIGRPFDEMSGGQKQRIVIAVCLSLQREIILLDEPTSSLDDASIYKLIEVIKELKGITVISASHDHNWEMSMDRVISL